MSALDLIERTAPTSILNYAPRCERAANYRRTSEPEPDRVRRRDEAGCLDDRVVQDAPTLDPFASDGVTLRSFDPFSLIGRIAVVVAAVAAVGGVGLLAMNLYQPKASDPPPAQPDSTSIQADATSQSADPALPHKIHTVSFQAEKGDLLIKSGAPTATAAAAAPSMIPDTQEPAQAEVGSGLLPVSDVAVQPTNEGQLALTAPLTLWAALPGEAAAGGMPSAEFKELPAQQAASAEPPASPPQAASMQANAGTPEKAAAVAPKAAHHHTAHAHRRPAFHHHRRHRTRTAQAAQPAQASAQPATASPTSQTDSGQSANSLVSAFQSLFAHPQAKSDGSPAQQ